MYAPPRMPRQHIAVTGRKPNFDNLLRSYIHANIPALRRRIEADEETEFRERELGLSERAVRIKEEKATEMAKQGKIATVLSGVQTAGLGYLARRKAGLWEGKSVKPTIKTGLQASTTGLVTTGAKTPAAAGGFAGKGASVGLMPVMVGGQAGTVGASTLAPAAGGYAGAGASAGLSKVSAGGSGYGATRVGGAVGLELQRPFISKPLSKGLAGGLPGGEKEWGTIETMGIRAGQGALIAGVPGAVVGAGVGLVESLFSSCIIITAATDPHSYEVNVTREYRDRYLSRQTLRGYYMLGEQIVPLMHKSKLFKRFIKKSLVDHIVKYCEWGIGLRKKRPIISSFITETFLSFCDGLGSTKEYFTRLNGKVW